MTTTENFITGLQELIDFYRANPELPTPGIEHNTFNVYRVSKDQLQAFVKAAGKVSKNAFDNTFYVTHKFPGGVRLDFNARREEVCERVVVGTRLVPAVDAQLVPAKPAHEEEIVEWKCSPILAKVEA